MAPSVTTQINARIDSALKESGDAGLAAAGFTPTKAVRALWSLASRWRATPERIVELFDATGDGCESAAIEERCRGLREGANLYEEGLRRLGVSGERSMDFRSLSELKELAYRERGSL